MPADIFFGLYGLQRLHGSLPMSKASCKVISVAFSMPLQSALRWYFLPEEEIHTLDCAESVVAVLAKERELPAVEEPDAEAASAEASEAAALPVT